MYQAQEASRSEFVPIRNLQYHVRIWGEPTAGQPPLVMVHGWMDVGASYQFVVDALAQDRWVIAPDWRGYGLTSGGGADNYWFPDYLADLDFLLDHYSPGAPVDLVGHSMGGNVVMLYAGVRPERIRRLINLEGFGMPATRPPRRRGAMRNGWTRSRRCTAAKWRSSPTTTLAGVARRLMKTNPRLSQDKADWLARHWARPMRRANG
jgi:pimeloyl-ACP methyl ester carboxylesterase